MASVPGDLVGIFQIQLPEALIWPQGPLLRPHFGTSLSLATWGAVSFRVKGQAEVPSLPELGIVAMAPVMEDGCPWPTRLIADRPVHASLSVML